MLTMTSAKATTMARPGTNSLSSAVLTWLNESIRARKCRQKCRSRTDLACPARISATIRGENCPMPSWITTKTTVRTNAVRLTIEPAMVPNLQGGVWTTGEPTGNQSPLNARSTETLATDTAMPVAMQQAAEPHAGPQPMQYLEAGEPEQRPILPIAPRRLRKASERPCPGH